MTRFKGPDGQEDMPYLMTAGPVTTSRDVKFAMLADWDDHGPEFRRVTRNVATSLQALAHCDSNFECILIEGSRESAIEAALGSFAPSKRKKTLITSNGLAGQYAIDIMRRIGRNHTVLNMSELQPLNPKMIAQALDDDRNISHVWVVQCEMATGVINPVADIATVIKSRDRVMMVDASSCFGALPIDMVAESIDVLVGCSGLCLEGPPGLSFVLANRDLIAATKGESHSLALDLFEQWQALAATGRFRFPPPTHVLLGLHQALRHLELEGGVQGRSQRYAACADAFNTRMRALGFSFLLAANEICPIVQIVLAPADTHFNFNVFQDNLLARGYAIAPGLLPGKKSFRIGTIGQIDEKLMVNLVTAIEAVMNEMDVRSFAPSMDS